MIFWLDAQLPPSLADFLKQEFGVEAVALRDLGLRDAEDAEIFARAKEQNSIMISKDSDFVDLVERLGSPPQLLWLTCGNASNKHLQKVFSKVWPDAIKMLQAGEDIIEVADIVTE